MKRFIRAHIHEIVVILAIVIGLNIFLDSFSFIWYLDDPSRGLKGGCWNMLTWEFPVTRQVPHIRIWELSFSLLLLGGAALFAISYERKLKKLKAEQGA